MKLQDIKNSITTISGIGPAAAKLFAKLNIFTVADLLSFYPKNYEDIVFGGKYPSIKASPWGEAFANGEWWGGKKAGGW